MKTPLLIIGTLSLLTCLADGASFVVNYADNLSSSSSFAKLGGDGSSYASSSTVAGVTISNMKAGGTIGVGGDNLMYYRNQIVNSKPFDTGAIASNLRNWSAQMATTSTSHFYEFSLTADSGGMLDISNISFDWRTAVNFDYQGMLVGNSLNFLAGIWYSVDGGTYQQLGSDFTTTAERISSSSGQGMSNVVNVSQDMNLADPVQSITFRIAFGVNGATDDTKDKAGVFSFIQNLRINGETVAAPIPEPSTAALALLGLAGVLRRRR